MPYLNYFSGKNLLLSDISSISKPSLLFTCVSTKEEILDLFFLIVLFMWADKCAYWLTIDVDKQRVFCFLPLHLNSCHGLLYGGGVM